MPGDCSLKLLRSNEEEGESGRKQQDNGELVFTHFFKGAADADFFESPFGPVANVKVDPSTKRLVFTPANFSGFSNKASQVTFPGKIRGPFKVEVDLEASGKDFEFQTNPMPTRVGQRQAIVSIKSADAFKQEATVRVGNMTSLTCPPLNGTASRETIWVRSKPGEATNATRKEGTG